MGVRPRRYGLTVAVGLAVPVLTWEGGLFDDFGMTAASGTQVTSQTSLEIVSPGHPLAAGLAGTVGVSSTAGLFTQGSPNANATIVARLPGSTTASIFAYDTGAAMPGLAAPARRIGLFMTDLTAATFTASGTALFDAAIAWAVGASGGPTASITAGDPSATAAATSTIASARSARSSIRST